MPRPEAPKAQSIYRGVRLTITQPPDGDQPCIVTLAVKQTYQPWDQWDLIFPAIRVPVGPLEGYSDVLKAVGRVLEGVLESDRQYR